MADALAVAYEANQILLTAASRLLEEEVREAMSSLKHVDRIAFRVKLTKSFIDKARDPKVSPPYTDPLVEVEDQIAGRVIVFALPDIDRVVERLANTFSFIESSRRRPAKDDEFGYESHHLICMIPPQVQTSDWRARAETLPNTCEIQIRTLFMHAWAEPQHDLSYKSPTELPYDTRRELAWIAASAWGADQAFKRVRDWEEFNRPVPTTNPDSG